MLSPDSISLHSTSRRKVQWSPSLVLQPISLPEEVTCLSIRVILYLFSRQLPRPPGAGPEPHGPQAPLPWRPRPPEASRPHQADGYLELLVLALIQQLFETKGTFRHHRHWHFPAGPHALSQSCSRQRYLHLLWCELTSVLCGLSMARSLSVF